MALYVCLQIEETTNQCQNWFDLNSSIFAITGSQASLIITAIAGYYLTMWLLNKSRKSVK